MSSVTNERDDINERDLGNTANNVNITQPRSGVQLVAVASDESAYFAQWIHHHLFMGFDAVHILVNRTSDNSIDLLEHLANKDSRVTYECVDWIDLCKDEVRKNMQFVAYAHHIHHLKTASTFEYFMLLDIDEFWTPVDPQHKIQHYIKALTQADSISFQWINHFGTPGQFNLLDAHIVGRLNKLVKTVYKIETFSQEVKLHLSSNQDHLQVLCDGDVFVSHEEGSEQLHADLSQLRPAMIIHRMFRSPVEYISLLARGRPSDDLPLKLNRGGYNKAYGESVAQDFSILSHPVYLDSYAEFINDADMLELHETGKAYVLSRYHRAFEGIKRTDFSHIRDVFKIFSGIAPSERFNKNTLSLIKLATQKRTTTFQQALNIIPKEFAELASMVERAQKDASN